jgi:hypothetical protein
MVMIMRRYCTCTAIGAGQAQSCSVSALLKGLRRHHYLLFCSSEPPAVANELLNKARIKPVPYGKQHAELLPFIRDLAPNHSDASSRRTSTFTPSKQELFKSQPKLEFKEDARGDDAIGLNRFAYTRKTPFLGRKQEITTLDAFLTDKTSFCW